MALKVTYDFVSFLCLTARNLNMSCLELSLLVGVVTSYVFNLLTHVVSTHIPVGVLSELVSVELVIYLVLDGIQLELLQRGEDLLLKELLHCCIFVF